MIFLKENIPAWFQSILFIVVLIIMGIAFFILPRENISLVEKRRLASDPVFSGRLIKAANGANRIGARPIVSIQDAIPVLGVP